MQPMSDTDPSRAERGGAEGAPSIGIAAVERQTGVPKELLRAWERRYSFPRPSRGSDGERLYSPDEVAKLTLVRRLVDLGHRPGAVIDKSMRELEALLPVVAAPRAAPKPLQPVLDLLEDGKITDFRARLARRLLADGLRRCVLETLQPLVAEIGDAWSCGKLAIYEEHLLTEQLQQVLRGAIGALPPTGGSPLVLLTTLPGEWHGIGLLMTEALFTAEGATCLSLGVQTPVAETIKCAEAERVDIVALSCTAAGVTREAQRALGELQQRLDPSIEIWLGGAGAPLIARSHPRIVLVSSLEEGLEKLSVWQARKS